MAIFHNFPFFIIATMNDTFIASLESSFCYFNFLQPPFAGGTGLTLRRMGSILCLDCNHCWIKEIMIKKQAKLFHALDGVSYICSFFIKGLFLAFLFPLFERLAKSIKKGAFFLALGQETGKLA